MVALPALDGGDAEERAVPLARFQPDGHWTEPPPPSSQILLTRGHEGPPVRGLQAMLSLYGYDQETNGVFDARTEAAVAAFQRHFRPERVDGAADVGTVETLKQLQSGLSAGRMNSF